MRIASSLLPLLGFLLATSVGCAGARVSVTADKAKYPISFSGAVRDRGGVLHAGPTLQKVGDFAAGRTSVGLLYSTVSLPGTWDVSEEINRQVQAAGGEAVINFRLAVTSSCTALNAFPLLNALPIWPGCAPLGATGDIVVRAGPRK
jgi:hypothetical protein